MSQGFSELFLLFFAYSMAGWLCETLYCSIPAKKPVKRGFLRGPYCPIYGVGALFILGVSEPVIQSPALVFAVSALSATLLEYVTGWLLEKLFGIRWWDYSGKRFQLRGRICLKNSLLFGALGLVVARLLHPRVLQLLGAIPDGALRPLANLLQALFLFDLLTTVARLTGFSQRLAQLQTELQALRESHGRQSWLDLHDLEGSLRRLREPKPDLPEPERGRLITRLEAALEKGRAGIPQLGSYNSARTRSLSEAWETARDEYRRRREARPSRRLSIGRVGRRTAAAGRATARTIRDNLSYYRLFWVFLLAGVLGYLVETLHCLLTTGTIESRQGLLYGPFNQVYGFGAVLMVLLLAPLAKKNDRWLFLGGAVLGGGFEVLCSVLQETVFGSVSWQYGEAWFAIAGGRTSLLYMFFWGILGLWFIKGLYPHLLSFIERIPLGSRRWLTAVLTLLLAVNMLLSGAAVLRWSQRVGGEAGQGALGAWLDESYPDEFMQRVYPNMHWPEKPAQGER